MHLSHNYSTIISWLCLKIGYTYPSMAVFSWEQWPFSMGFLGSTGRFHPSGRDGRHRRIVEDQGEGQIDPPATAAVEVEVDWVTWWCLVMGGLGHVHHISTPCFQIDGLSGWKELKCWRLEADFLVSVEVDSAKRLGQTFQKCLLKRCSWGLTWMWFTKVAGASQLMGVRFGYKQFEPQLHPAVGTSSFTIFDCTDINVKWIDPHFGIHIRKNEWCTQWIGPRNSFKNIFKYLGQMIIIH